MKLRILALAVLVLLPGAPLLAHGLGFFDNLKVAVEVSRVRGTMLVIFFTGSDWSPLSHELDVKVWENTEFASVASERCSFYLADYPQRVRQDPKRLQYLRNLAEHFQVRYFPTIIAVTPELEVIGRHEYHGESGPEILSVAEQWSKKFETLHSAHSESPPQPSK